MPIVNLAVDTSTHDYDISKFKDISLAILAGKKNEEDRQNILRVIPTSYDDLVAWLSKDLERNISFVESYATNLASFVDPEKLIEFPKPGKIFNVDDIILAMSNLQVLERSADTLNLAQQVVGLERDDRDIDLWAEELANDISRGTD